MCIRDSTDTARGDDPVSVFCGDTLFVGDVGRPDLFPGIANELAGKLYHSLHDKLLKLPDYCEVYPAHGAGSLCGRAMGAKRSSTIGYEKRYNQILSVGKDEFIRGLTTDMPPAPDHFSRCSRINGAGPKLLKEISAPAPLTPNQFKKVITDEHSIVLDIRDYDSFGGQHIEGAFNIGLAGNFATFSGWILPHDKNIYLVTDNNAQVPEAVSWLRKVGLDNVSGYLEGGMKSWVIFGYPFTSTPQISSVKLHDLLTGKEEFALVDVRSAAEFEKQHIKGAVNIPVPDLRTRFNELKQDMKTFVMCSTGNRSSMGVSILEQKGFKNLFNLPGGMMGYSAAGFVKECPVCFTPHGPHFLGFKVSL